MSAERYRVVEGSELGHGCCFDSTVVDTHKGINGHYKTVCECAEMEDAEHICKLLNKGDTL